MPDGHDQVHGERLSPVDTAFLEMERPNVHMHVGALLILEPPDKGEFSFSRFIELVRSRLHLVPRYRQKLMHPPLRLTNPIWIDDTEFDLSYHVRHAALPRPGTTEQLTDYAVRVLSRQLDRDRPLWELYVIEGLEEGRIAILGKTHHAMVDDLSGADLVSVLLDASPEQSAELEPPEPWQPAGPPTRAELLADAARDAAASPASLAASGRRLVRAPGSAAQRAVEVARGVASVVRAGVAHPAPRSLLNQEPGAFRRLVLQRLPLADLKLVKDTFGTTVNDVVLTLVADATGRYLRSRGARTDGLWLRAMVPVGTRSESELHVLGSRVVAAFVDLPMFEMDPVERLRVCEDGMREVKTSHHAVGAGFLIGLTAFAPPTLHAMASRLAVSTRLYNFLVTNVPGPRDAVYCLGSRLLAMFPFTPLAPTQSYAVGVTSIGGSIDFGITADYDALPDVEEVAAHLAASLAELLLCVEAEQERPLRSRRPVGTATDGVLDG